MKDAKLWERISAHPFDYGDPELSFAARLQVERGWSEEFARGAIFEYRRFIYLVAISPTMITPSEIIDEVWHLHLCYTENYWEQLCARVVGKPIHHSPTLGGKAENVKFTAAYEDTKLQYRREFGEHPPEMYWPLIRGLPLNWFGRNSVNTKTHFLVSKANVLNSIVLAGLGTIVLGGLTLPKNSTAVYMTFTLGMVATFAALFYGRATGIFTKDKNSSGGGSSGCGSDGGGCSGGGGCGGGCGGD
jgi:hypothetical protein